MHNKDNEVCECERCATFRKIGLKNQTEFVEKFIFPLRDVISKSLMDQKAHVESFNLSKEDNNKVSLTCLLTNVEVLAFITSEIEISSGGNIQEFMEIALLEFSHAASIISKNQLQPLNDKTVENKVVNTTVQSMMLN